MRLGSCSLALLLGSLVACQAPPSPVVDPVSKSASRSAKAGKGALSGTAVPVEGKLLVPRQMAVAAGVRLISDRSAGIISDRGTLFRAALRAPFRLLAVETVAVEGARVFLSDASGQPIPDVPAVKTDADGRFRLPRVPSGLTFLVAAEVPTATGKTAAFRSLVRVGEVGATTQIDPASTLVTGHLVEGLPRGELGDLNPVQFQRATEATAARLNPESLPDFSDPAAVRGLMKQLSEEVAELRDQLSELRRALSDLQATVTALQDGPASATQVSAPPGADKTPAPISAPVASETGAPAGATPTATPTLAPRTTASAAPVPTAQQVLLRGTVFDEAGQPVDGAQVGIRSLDASVAFDASTTTQQGLYLFPNVPAGIQVQIATLKAGWTARSRATNTQPPPGRSEGTMNFGTAASAPQDASSAYFISNRPEIVSVASVTDPKMPAGTTLACQVILSEPMPQSFSSLEKALYLLPVTSAAGTPFSWLDQALGATDGVPADLAPGDTVRFRFGLGGSNNGPQAVRWNADHSRAIFYFNQPELKETKLQAMLFATGLAAVTDPSGISLGTNAAGEPTWPAAGPVYNIFRAASPAGRNWNDTHLSAVTVRDSGVANPPAASF
ncbi:MAG: hypothetical protein VKP62_04165 [Candidatus Sericytochromatia bacterium]|nr:hypothetical protein [Candidatus Sericytochromatia bacterium]